MIQYIFRNIFIVSLLFVMPYVPVGIKETKKKKNLYLYVMTYVLLKFWNHVKPKIFKTKFSAEKEARYQKSNVVVVFGITWQFFVQKLKGL